MWLYSTKITVVNQLRWKGKLPTGQAVADIFLGRGWGSNPAGGRASPGRVPFWGPLSPPLCAGAFGTAAEVPRLITAPPGQPRGRRSCGGARPWQAGKERRAGHAGGTAELRWPPTLTTARLRPHRHRRLRSAVPSSLPEPRRRLAAAVRVRIRVQARATPGRRHLEGATAAGHAGCRRLAAGHAGGCSPSGQPPTRCLRLFPVLLSGFCTSS